MFIPVKARWVPATGPAFTLGAVSGGGGARDVGGQACRTVRSRREADHIRPGRATAGAYRMGRDVEQPDLGTS